jgi:predicted DsbA family dithiol-disulfide isomerase
MAAYWSEGRDLGDHGVLRELAAESGISPAGTEAALVERTRRAAVDASTVAAQRLGISGIPAFVIDDRVLVLGAQSHEALAAAVEQARTLAG